MPFKVPNIDTIWNHNPIVAEALQSLRDGIETMGQKLSVNPQGPTNAPAPPSAINITAAGGITHVALEDNNPRTRNVHYFVEYDTNPNFTNAQTIHLGTARQTRVPTFLGGSTYWRAYSQYPDSPRSDIKYYGTPENPSAVSDGAVGGGSAGILLQTNGVSNGSQTKLNLAAGSNITLLDDGSGDVTISASSSSIAFGTAGQGWFSPVQLMPFVPSSLQGVGSVISSGAPAANVVGAVQIMLPWTVTIRAIGLYVVTGAGVGFATTTIYNAAGTTKLVDAGANAFDTHTNSQILRTVVLGTPVTLNPGLYWWATGSTDGAGTVPGYSMYNFLPPVINGNSVVRYGSAANALSAGAMPSSLGTVTGYGTVSSQNIPLYMFYV